MKKIETEYRLAADERPGELVDTPLVLTRSPDQRPALGRLASYLTGRVHGPQDILQYIRDVEHPDLYEANCGFGGFRNIHYRQTFHKMTGSAASIKPGSIIYLDGMSFNLKDIPEGTYRLRIKDGKWRTWRTFPFYDDVSDRSEEAYDGILSRGVYALLHATDTEIKKAYDIEKKVGEATQVAYDESAVKMLENMKLRSLSKKVKANEVTDEA